MTLYSAHHAEQYRQWLDGKAVDKPHAWADKVIELWRTLPDERITILDYGCSRRRLRNSLPVTMQNWLAEYDPGVPGFETPSWPRDLVVCTDVLEHVEPECLDAVLADLKRVTLNTLLLSVSTKHSEMTLPDGTLQHKIVQPAAWWAEKIAEMGMSMEQLPCKAQEVAWVLRA